MDANSVEHLDEPVWTYVYGYFCASLEFNTCKTWGKIVVVSHIYVFVLLK